MNREPVCICGHLESKHSHDGAYCPRGEWFSEIYQFKENTAPRACEYCAGEGQIARHSETAESVTCPACRGSRIQS